MPRTLQIFTLLIVAAIISHPPATNAREPSKPCSAKPEAQALIDAAWAALDQYMRIKDIDKAIGYLEQAAALDPQNDALLIELAGEYFQRGYQMPADSKAEIEARNLYFRKGYDIAEQALLIKESAGSHGWTFANLGGLKQYSNFMSQVAILPELNKHLDWITANKKDYKYGFATRCWAGILSRAPDVIVRILGENPDEIYSDLEKAILEEPRYLENYLYMAELQYSKKKKDEALKYLDQALQIDLNSFPEELAYNRFMREAALTFWQEWTGVEYSQRR